MYACICALFFCFVFALLKNDADVSLSFIFNA